jgi:hypothetical protein
VENERRRFIRDPQRGQKKRAKAETPRSIAAAAGHEGSTVRQGKAYGDRRIGSRNSPDKGWSTSRCTSRKCNQTPVATPHLVFDSPPLPMYIRVSTMTLVLTKTCQEAPRVGRHTSQVHTSDEVFDASLRVSF